MTINVYFSSEFIKQVNASKKKRELLALIEILEKRQPAGVYAYIYLKEKEQPPRRIEYGEDKGVDGTYINILSDFDRFLWSHAKRLLVKKPSWGEGFWRAVLRGMLLGGLGGLVSFGLLFGIIGLTTLVPSLVAVSTLLFTLPAGAALGSGLLVFGVLCGVLGSAVPRLKRFYQEQQVMNEFKALLADLNQNRRVFYPASDKLKTLCNTALSWKHPFWLKKTNGSLAITFGKEDLTTKESRILGSISNQLTADLQKSGIDEKDYMITESEDEKTMTIKPKENEAVIKKTIYLLGDASGSCIKEEDKKKLEEEEEYSGGCTMQ